jgi:enoyl-CoA hydratase/carnithine racemase
MQDWRANSLAVSGRAGITQWHVPRPAARSEERDRLAWAIVDAAAALAEDERVPRGVLITSGGRSFLVDPPSMSATPWSRSEAWQQAVDAVAHIECPVIAAIQGDAIGPGWQLALACDLRIASAGLRFGVPDHLTARAPIDPQSEPLLSTDHAFSQGLLTDVVPPAELERATEQLASAIGRNAPIAAAYAKEAVRRSVGLTLADGMQVEQDLNVLLQTTSDRAEGIAAFLERRAPRFFGR